MVRYFFISLLFLIIACTHNIPSPEVKTFVQSMKDQYEPHDPYYAEVYARYLASVENIYRQDSKSAIFRSYLDSLNNNYQILDQQKTALPELYHQRTGRKIASTDKDYKLFKTETMSSLHDKLFTARELKIKDEVGPKTYRHLRENYAKFVQRENAVELGFPL